VWTPNVTRVLRLRHGNRHHDQLTRLGYVAVGITAFGEEVVERARHLDQTWSNLHGESHGFAAAEQIRSRFSLSVVYVTANAALAPAQNRNHLTTSSLAASGGGWAERFTPDHFSRGIAATAP
jgi:hypothetical protein